MSIDKELIRKARQSDLASYLSSIGVPLVRTGQRYKHKDHDSLVFTKNAYFWNSRQESGNAVDYLTKHMGMTFDEAVMTLTDFVPPSFEVEVKQNQSYILEGFNIANDYKRAIAYLSKTRAINYSVIKNLIDTKHIFQEAETNNIVFAMYDEQSKLVGAELQGTLTQKRFKGIKESSKYGYGFNIRYSKSDFYKYALFFESAVDLVSFVDLKQNYEKKELKDCILISMSGLKANVVECTVNAFEGVSSVVLCIDNDNAGEEFKSALKRLDLRFRTLQPKSEFKDWNEQLVSIKKEQEKNFER